MKKERVVVLCLCAVLLGTLYAQWMSWACHVVMPSMDLSARLMPCGAFLSPGSAVEFVSAGWPPLGWVYSEFRRMHVEPEGINVQGGNGQNPTQCLTKPALQPGVK